MKRRYDIRSAAETFSRREMVWLHNPQQKKGLSPKLSWSWEGPYVVVHKVNDVVQDPTKYSAKPKAVHRYRLWKYRGEAHAHWFTEAPWEPVEEVPEETAMQREPLASDDNRNALPCRRRRRRDLPPRFRSNRFQASDAHVAQEGSRRSQRSRSSPQRSKDFVRSWPLEERHSAYSKVIMFVFRTLQQLRHLCLLLL